MRKYIFLLMLSLLPLSLSAQEQQIGTSFLLSRGVPADSIRLEELMVEGVCHVFSNSSPRGGWVIVADSKYADVYPSQVLAYSLRGYFGGSLNGTYRDIFAYYERCLNRLQSEHHPDTQLLRLTETWKACEPLMGDISWYQLQLPIEWEGKTLSVKSGCVGTAEALLLKYWQHPDRIRGQVEFMLDDVTQKSLLCKLDGITINWPDYAPVIPRDKAKQDLIARLQAMCSMTLSPKYGEGSTSANFHQLKYSLVNHFDFSPRMKLLRHGLFDVPTMLNAAYTDLQHQRVVAVTNKGHAFLLDGYSDGMFHFNFGWGGSADGYYSLFTHEALLTNIMVNIVPNEASATPTERTIEVKKAGTLVELLPEAEAMNVGKLTLIGKLNGADWQLLRRMAGAVSVEQPSASIGVLTELDLTGARFVESKHHFLRLPSAEIGLNGHFSKNVTVKMGEESVTQTKTVKYDLRSMNHKMFTDLKGYDTMRRNFIVDEEVPDSVYWVRLFLCEDALPVFMFHGCDNLNTLRIGKTIGHVDHACFRDCVNLEHLVFEGSDVTFSESVFANARRLKTIAVRNRENLKSSMFKQIFTSSLQILPLGGLKK